MDLTHTGPAVILFGGVHGVGKSTLLSGAEYPGDSVAFFDPGPLFTEHLCHRKDKSSPEIERMVSDKLIALSRNHPLVISNWHWAVWTPKGYVPQLAEEEFLRFLRGSRPRCLYLVEVTAPVELVLARRLEDKAFRKRKLDLNSVHEEAAMSDAFRYRCFKAAAEVCTVQFVDIINVDLAEGRRATRALMNAAYDIGRPDRQQEPAPPRAPRQ